MNLQRFRILPSGLILLSLVSFGAGAESRLKTSRDGMDTKGFVHPGILHTTADLERMRRQVEAGAQPYLDGFKTLQRHPQ